MSFRPAAFSLLEVVVALAVVTVGIMGILSLLPRLIGQQADAEAMQMALRLPDAIRCELRRLADGNLDALEGRLANLGADTGSALRLTAGRHGAEVKELTTVVDDAPDQFFLIELFRFPAGVLPAYDTAAGFVAVHARASWPYRVRVGESMVEVSVADRQAVTFNLAVNR